MHHCNIARLAIVLFSEKRVSLFQQHKPQLVQIIKALQTKLRGFPSSSYPSPNITQKLTINDILSSDARLAHELLQPALRKNSCDSSKTPEAHRRNKTKKMANCEIPKIRSIFPSNPNNPYQTNTTTIHTPIDLFQSVLLQVFIRQRKVVMVEKLLPLKCRQRRRLRIILPFFRYMSRF